MSGTVDLVAITLRLAPSLVTVLCSGCIGLPAPDGAIWHIVETAGPSDAVQSSPFPKSSLGGRLHAYLAAKLPLSPRQFVQALNAEHFRCNRFGEGLEGGTNIRIPESHPITCWYVARGSTDSDDACHAGAAIMIQVQFQGPDAITDFDLTQMSFADSSAHASGICAPL